MSIFSACEYARHAECWPYSPPPPYLGKCGCTCHVMTLCPACGLEMRIIADLRVSELWKCHACGKLDIRRARGEPRGQVTKRSAVSYADRIVFDVHEASGEICRCGLCEDCVPF